MEGTRPDRDHYTRLIVESSSPKKLVVAGPGTGKTFAFQACLRAVGGNGLALTFINNLVRDLEVELEGLAKARMPAAGLRPFVESVDAWKIQPP
jgi:hypothetical protein